MYFYRLQLRKLLTKICVVGFSYHEHCVLNTSRGVRGIVSQDVHATHVNRLCSAEEHQLSIGAPEYALQQEYSGSRESNAKVYLHVATVDPPLGGKRAVFTRTDAIMIVNYLNSTWLVIGGWRFIYIYTL